MITITICIKFTFFAFEKLCKGAYLVVLTGYTNPIRYRYLQLVWIETSQLSSNLLKHRYLLGLFKIWRSIRKLSCLIYYLWNDGFMYKTLDRCKLIVNYFVLICLIYTIISDCDHIYNFKLIFCFSIWTTDCYSHAQFEKVSKL